MDISNYLYWKLTQILCHCHPNLHVSAAENKSNWYNNGTIHPSTSCPSVTISGKLFLCVNLFATQAVGPTACQRSVANGGCRSDSLTFLFHLYHQYPTKGHLSYSSSIPWYFRHIFEPCAFCCIEINNVYMMKMASGGSVHVSELLRKHGL